MLKESVSSKTVLLGNGQIGHLKSANLLIERDTRRAVDKESKDFLREMRNGTNVPNEIIGELESHSMPNAPGRSRKLNGGAPQPDEEWCYGDGDKDAMDGMHIVSTFGGTVHLYNSESNARDLEPRRRPKARRVL